MCIVAKDTWYEILKFNVPSRGTIENAVRRDLDVLFKVKHFQKILLFQKWWELAQQYKISEYLYFNLLSIIR